LIFDGCGVKKSCCARHFDLLHKREPYRTYVRRQARVVCLVGSFDLCQSVKKPLSLRATKGSPQRRTAFVGRGEAKARMKFSVSGK